VAATRPAHSLHANFLAPARPGEPITFDVEACREGASFSTRTVTARQAGRAVLTMAASFHDDEPSVEYQQQAALAPGPTPPPDASLLGLVFLTVALICQFTSITAVHIGR
jgi:acyl-CoA thioesterase-2